VPTYFRQDEKPVVEFDPRLEMSPFTLFQRLRKGEAPLLIDVRDEPTGHTLRGATRLTDPSWRPPDGTEVVLFDDQGAEAVALARRFQQEGHAGVRALFGGLELYEFSLDPEVVGAETFLDPL
jgi:hypothetical protein